jgi:NAD(P)-dependent dehydrogenase (short-subunit alcohol dehydrogenase family)
MNKKNSIQSSAKAKAKRPAQKQNKTPGLTSPMNPQPDDTMTHYLSSNRFKGKVAIVTGGDSGIGRAVAIGFAKEGADVVIVYLNETKDAEVTASYIEREGQIARLIKGDIGNLEFCQSVALEVLNTFGQIDVLINNAAEQTPQESILDITEKQLENTFRTNIFSMFYMTQAVLPFLKPGSSIVNTASVTAYKGSAELLDYSATKGAIIAFTRSLSQNFIEKEIRVNAVAPGPIWTPLIPSTFSKEEVKEFGSDTPMGRAGQPDEVAPSFLFLASDDASYITGQVLHPNGGRIVNS